MSTNQSAKYKKFILGAASAALVASAVAPVVASAKDFNDTKGNTHEPAIDALSDAGVITGYPDGSFLPNKTLTRSDVVKLMGKWLVTEGYKVPTDYKTNMRFTDLTPTSNDELLQYAAVVKENGVFNGSNGRLLAGDNITRENMAVVIVRAFDQVNNMDLVTYVNAQDFKKDVIDLAKAKAEARPAIDVLDYFNITNPAAPTFNPKNTTTRGQFATFLHKSINTDFSAVKAPEVDVDKIAVDTAAAQVKAGAVTVARGEYATDKNKLAAVQAYVTSLVTEKNVVATVSEGKTPGDYVVTLTKGEAKAEKTIAITFEFAADDRFVTDVNAINGKELQVTFSQPVKESSIIDTTTNQLKTGVFKIDNATAANKAELSANGKTLTIYATSNWVGAHSIELLADKAETKTGENFAQYAKAFIGTDTTRASITGVEYVSKYVYKVNFSEPIKSTGTVTGKLADGSSATITSQTLSTDGKSAIITFTNTTPVNKEITMSFPTLEDFAGNVSVPLTAKTTISDADQTKPTVTSMTATSNTTVKVQLSKKVTLTDASKVKFNGASTSVTLDTKDSTVLYVTVPSTTTSGVLLLGADAVTDLSGNKNVAYSQTVLFTVDKAAPKVVSQEVVKVSGKNTLVLNFSGNLVTGTQTALTFKYVDQYGVSKTVTVPTAKVAIDADDKSKVKITLEDSTSTALKVDTDFTVDLPKGYFKDGFSNESEAKTISFLNSADTTETKLKLVTTTPVIDGASRTDGAFLEIKFADAVNATSAKNVANYAVEGAEVSRVELGANDPSTGATVHVYLKDNTVKATGNYNVTINGVKGYSSSVTTMDAVTKNILIKENIRPTVKTATVDSFNAIGSPGKTKVTLTFTEVVSETVVSGDFELYIDGVKDGATVASAVDSTDGKNVTVTIGKDLAAAIASGKDVKLVATSVLDLKDAAGNVVDFKEVKIK